MHLSCLVATGTCIMAMQRGYADLLQPDAPLVPPTPRGMARQRSGAISHNPAPWQTVRREEEDTVAAHGVAAEDVPVPEDDEDFLMLETLSCDRPECVCRPRLHDSGRVHGGGEPRGR